MYITPTVSTKGRYFRWMDIFYTPVYLVPDLTSAKQIYRYFTPEINTMAIQNKNKDPRRDEKRSMFNAKQASHWLDPLVSTLASDVHTANPVALFWTSLASRRLSRAASNSLAVQFWPTQRA